jgi:hypothetical protein
MAGGSRGNRMCCPCCKGKGREEKTPLSLSPPPLPACCPELTFAPTPSPHHALSRFALPCAPPPPQPHALSLAFLYLPPHPAPAERISPNPTGPRARGPRPPPLKNPEPRRRRSGWWWGGGETLALPTSLGSLRLRSSVGARMR